MRSRQNRLLLISALLSALVGCAGPSDPVPPDLRACDGPCPPCDLTGTWTGSATVAGSPDASGPIAFELVQRGVQVRGMVLPTGGGRITEGTLMGDLLMLYVQGLGSDFAYTARVAASCLRLSGTYAAEGFSGTWAADRR